MWIWLDFLLQAFVQALAWCLAIPVALAILVVIAVAGCHAVAFVSERRR